LINLRHRSYKIATSLFAMCIPLLSCTSGEETSGNVDAEPFLTAKFWRTPVAGANYPEMQDNDIKDRPSFGVAFQGGGNRAAPAALGQLRTLHELKWIDDVRYITAVSGGSWAAIPYTFLKKCPSVSARNCDQQQFLGVTHSPSEVARQIPKLANATTLDDFEDGSLLGAISNGTISGKVVNGWLKGKFDESYAAALGKIYLKPFGLSNSAEGVPNSVFTWRDTDRDRILRENPRLKDTPIHYVERERPFLIAGGTMLTKRTFIKSVDKFRMEMTPLYTGIPQKIKYKVGNGSHIEFGGGFIDSFGYDYVTDQVSPSRTTAELTLRNPIFGNRTNYSRLNYSLSDMAAVSGAAPVEKAVSVPGLRILASNFGFPEHYIPGPEKTSQKRRLSASKGTTFEKEWAHGDGGHEDNLGLAPLLARQVENILVFANSAVPIDGEHRIEKERDSYITQCERGLAAAGSTLPDHNELEGYIAKCIDMVGGDLPAFFVRTKDNIHNVGLSLLDSKVPDGQETLRGYYDLLAVAKDLDDNQNLSCQRYHYSPVIKPASSENDTKHGPIPSKPYKPMICILFLGLDMEWLKEIRRTVSADGMSDENILAIQQTLNLNEDWSQKPRRGQFAGKDGFPHIRTFWDTPGYLIHTSRPRLFALSNFTSWKLRDLNVRIKQEFRRNGLDL
jgi:hypothetical protein